MSVHTLTTLVLIATFSANAHSQSVMTELQQELTKADHGIWEAVAGKHPDIPKVSAALADDYLDIDSGTRHSRQEAIDYLKGLTNFSFEYAAARAYVLSASSGYVIAELTYSSVQNGTAASGKVLTTTVFAKEHGRWIAHLHTEMDMELNK